jgi:hypothetical protein
VVTLSKDDMTRWVVVAVGLAVWAVVVVLTIPIWMVFLDHCVQLVRELANQ